ncbi:MAG: YggT family protein [Coriobacteriia bacterium]|nr:YggT family protein [Coriobacteriia bacterium]
MLIFVYVIMSWFPMRGMLYDIYGVIGSVVEPWVGLFRRLIPPIAGFDFSPWAAILVIRFVIVPLLYQVISLAT